MKKKKQTNIFKKRNDKTMENLYFYYSMYYSIFDSNFLVLFFIFLLFLIFIANNVNSIEITNCGSMCSTDEARLNPFLVDE